MSSNIPSAPAYGVYASQLRFKEFISDIYPKELTISETTESTSVASYLDLLFIRDNSNNITTKLYDKRDTFGFHIVNFPFMSSNIPSAPAYGVYASQLRFKEFISDIYPKELTISETTESTSVASYLDLLFIRDNSNNITTKLYDKRDTFGFHIVNFPFMSSNIPSAPAYGVYASQLRFKEFISDIYPKELTISETTESTSVASYLDLLFIRDNSNNITTKLYDKRDTFGFHIVNFPFMSSNIPSAPAYGVYASQLIRYAHCCSNYSDFLSRLRALVTRLLSQGYKVNRLSNTFKKFYDRHTDLVGQYKKSVCQMFADSIS